MGSGTQALAGVLDELASLLRRHGETHWASWIERDAGRIRDGDVTGVAHLLSAYGGMGSFDDLVLHPINGHRIDAAEVDPVNARLSDLRSRAWTLARARIERSLTRPDTPRPGDAAR